MGSFTIVQRCCLSYHHLFLFSQDCFIFLSSCFQDPFIFLFPCFSREQRHFYYRHRTDKSICREHFSFRVYRSICSKKAFVCFRNQNYLVFLLLNYRTKLTDFDCYYNLILMLTTSSANKI